MLIKKKNGFSIYIDLSKAFDLLDHGLLLDKLKKYGFRGRMGSWLRSYVSGRRQVTVVNYYQPLPKEVTCGMHQGSVLGPLLFLLFIKESAFVYFGVTSSVCLSGEQESANTKLVVYLVLIRD